MAKKKGEKIEQKQGKGKPAFPGNKRQKSARLASANLKQDIDKAGVKRMMTN